MMLKAAVLTTTTTLKKLRYILRSWQYQQHNLDAILKAGFPDLSKMSVPTTSQKKHKRSWI